MTPHVYDTKFSSSTQVQKLRFFPTESINDVCHTFFVRFLFLNYAGPASRSAQLWRRRISII